MIALLSAWALVSPPAAVAQELDAREPGSQLDAPESRADDERTEYEALINAAHFISILKLKARRHLDPNSQ